MLSCLAGAAGIMVIARHPSWLTRSFETPFVLIVIAGLPGAVIQIARPLPALAPKTGLTRLTGKRGSRGQAKVREGKTPSKP
jgi:hypothetical protein